MKCSIFLHWLPVGQTFPLSILDVQLLVVSIHGARDALQERVPEFLILCDRGQLNHQLEDLCGNGVHGAQTLLLLQSDSVACNDWKECIPDCGVSKHELGPGGHVDGVLVVQGRTTKRTHRYVDAAPFRKFATFVFKLAHPAIAFRNSSKISVVTEHCRTFEFVTYFKFHA